jgi:hypothetical protein
MFNHKRITAVVAAALMAGSMLVASTAADARDWPRGASNFGQMGNNSAPRNFGPRMGNVGPNNFGPRNFGPRNFGNFADGNRHQHQHHFNDGGAFAAGALGGLFIGNGYDPYDDYDPYYYDEGPDYDGSYIDGNNPCFRFRTYNPTTGMYMSYRGPRHCP